MPDVWGIDASLYQLNIATASVPAVRFVQGLAEATPFAAARFDGVLACFLFHELPTEAQDNVLREMQRVMRPGARLVIVEPSEEQTRTRSYRSLWKRHGWRGVYFRVLATFVTEPYLWDWHDRDVESWAERHGFVVESDTSTLPFRRLVLMRR